MKLRTLILACLLAFGAVVADEIEILDEEPRVIEENTCVVESDGRWLVFRGDYFKSCRLQPYPDQNVAYLVILSHGGGYWVQPITNPGRAYLNP